MPPQGFGGISPLGPIPRSATAASSDQESRRVSPGVEAGEVVGAAGRSRATLSRGQPIGRQDRRRNQSQPEKNCKSLSASGQLATTVLLAGLAGPHACLYRPLVMLRRQKRLLVRLVLERRKTVRSASRRWPPGKSALAPFHMPVSARNLWDIAEQRGAPDALWERSPHDAMDGPHRRRARLDDPRDRRDLH